MRVKKNISVEEAIVHFNKQRADVLEVTDEANKFVGYFTLDSLQIAIQKGDLAGEIENYVANDVHLSSSIIDEDVIRNEKVMNEYEYLLNKNYLKILNSLHDGVYITDQHGFTVFVNRAYERITGLNANEFIGVHMNEIINKGYISKSISLEVIKQKKPVTMMQKIINDRKIIVTGTPIYSSEGNIIFIINSVRDITELLKLKHELDGLHYWSNSDEVNSALQSDININELELYVSSPETKKLFELAERVAKTDVKVLLQGETGVGKSLIARFIHEKSDRNKEVFLELNCGAIPANLIEAELFGYEPGAFTGASKYGKKGLLEQADGGTLFLDEIGDLPLELQVKLLKVVEENRYMRIGSTVVQEVDVRILSASHKDLKKLVRNGKFREDLFYRLNIVPIHVPPLRNRKQEIIPLLQRFLERFNEKYNANKRFTIECLEYLTKHSWPGNIRELINIVERLVVTTIEDEITIYHLPEEYRNVFLANNHNGEEMTLKEAVEQFENNLIKETLTKYKTTRKVAEALGVSQSSIVQKLKRINVDQ
ncbi:hypothetical protein BKP35_16820 [Anaerobacillus arseniciselenatis]|uniref:HTH-type transcriptional regulatory protein TyrR n=1 Tax=Anaerobacillus arseniciselenatis TaxID=85682 RepID=A0A1S2LAI6_9BACI|nr:sigma 54-interacting transcriptional regulator [Anaerobacillus arseniciselenatis]OIJ09334.1 hypothetical protein BKP35_16820 [Anaerobacillus arseniciselenatis]